MPFGGAKMRVWGTELSTYRLDEYVNVKSVWIRTNTPSEAGGRRKVLRAGKVADRAIFVQRIGAGY
jgi:hypothetical protein